jgi:C-terminal binding protein
MANVAVTKHNVAMIGMFDHKPDIEEKILENPVMVHQSIHESPEKFSTYEGILAWHTDNFTKDTLSKFTSLKGIVRIGMGYDNVDLEYCKERGITVSNVPDYGTCEVADSAMSHILNLMRKTFALAHQTSHLNEWASQRGMQGARRVTGSVLGIVGFGRIGKCVALRAKSFGMQVLFYDPYVEHGIDKSLGVTRIDDLNSLLSKSDVVSVHALLNSETKHLINQKNIVHMKKGSFLVNTARGPIVEELGVIRGLKEGILAGVALDVLEVEPYKDGHLKEFIEEYRLIITPHSAFFSEEGYHEMRQKAALELRRILDINSPKYVVSK